MGEGDSLETQLHKGECVGEEERSNEKKDQPVAIVKQGARVRKETKQETHERFPHLEVKKESKRAHQSR